MIYKTMYRPQHPVRRTMMQTQDSFPKVNIMKSEAGYTLLIAVPGFSKEEINVSLDDKILKIKGEVRPESEVNPSNKISTGFHIKPFELKYELSEDLLNTEIQAEQKEGILKLWLPYNENAKRPAQSIEIK